MEKTERFEMLMEPREKELLRMLAEIERISAAAVLRRLLWQEAKDRLEIWDGQEKQGGGEAENGL